MSTLLDDQVIRLDLETALAIAEVLDETPYEELHVWALRLRTGEQVILDEDAWDLLRLLDETEADLALDVSAAQDEWEACDWENDDEILALQYDDPEKLEAMQDRLWSLARDLRAELETSPPLRGCVARAWGGEG
jgi:hypothetical protein